MKHLAVLIILSAVSFGQSITPPGLTYPSSPLFSGPTQVNECGGASGTVMTTYTDPLYGATVIRITDYNFDPNLAGDVHNTFLVSNGGSMVDNWIGQPPSWNQPRLLLVATSGNVKELVAYNPVTHSCYRPYYNSSSANCPQSCTVHGGWASGGDLDFDTSDPSGCTLIGDSGTSGIKYVFPSDVFPAGWSNNPCSPGTGPPAAQTVFNFIENSPAGCTGTACNCYPSDFGTATWNGEGGANSSGYYGLAAASNTYNRYINSDWSATTFAAASFIEPSVNNTGRNLFKTTSGGTSAGPEPNWDSACATTCTDGGGVVWTNKGQGYGQDTGIYVATYVPGKGCIAWNTMTNSITADPGFSGGAGLTCTATRCTGNTSGLGATFPIHQTKGGVNGKFFHVSNSGTLTGSLTSNDPIVWITGTATVYQSESTKTSGHFCAGQAGIINNPGSPVWSFYYRTQGTSGPGSPQQINTNFPSNNPSVDTHCSYQNANQNDTSGVFWTSDTVSLFNNGSGLMPFDCAPCTQPGYAEFDVIWNNGSQNTVRAAYTWNSGGANPFSAAQNISSCSPDGWFCTVGTDMLQQLGSVGGGGTGIGSGPFWLASKTYPLNYWLTPHAATNPGGYSYQVTTNGTASGTEPATWNQTIGGTQSDGSVVWTNMGVQTGTSATRTDVILVQFPTNFANSVP